jgi:carbamoyltransferase
MNLPNLAIAENHNANITLELNGQILEVIELERLLSSKNCAFNFDNPKKEIDIVLEHIYNIYGFKEYNILFTTEHAVRVVKIHELIPHKELKIIPHHFSHGSSTFYQSPFEEALVISYDGGGDDGMFNIYHATRNNGLQLIKDYNSSIDMGRYSFIGMYIEDINGTHIPKGEYFDFLTHPGKLMAYASLGEVNSSYIDIFRTIYTHIYFIPPNHWLPHYKKHFNQFNLDHLNWKDMAATNQKVFEDMFFELTDDFIKKYNLPICLSGGCALNVTLNTKIKEKYNLPMYVAPNSSDCGLSVGMILDYLKPQTPIDLRYSGILPVDKDKLMQYVNEYNMNTASVLNVYELLTQSNAVVGIIQGRAEHGPRALGNRSFIALATQPGIKDFINQQIKFREWYRPVAPIVRLEDVSTYFEWEGDSPCMNFAPKVREEYKELLKEIMHIDGTARIQTITKLQNPFLYNLLTIMDIKKQIPVIVNTSLNIQGMPLASSYKEALDLFHKLPMAGLYLDGYLLTDSKSRLM